MKALLKHLKAKTPFVALMAPFCAQSRLLNFVYSAQNRVGELYSLIRFLRIFPYAFYFCGAGTAKTSKVPPCDCRSLDHPFKKNHRKCDHCG